MDPVYRKEPAMPRTAYPTDLTDSQWTQIESLIPKAKSGGRPRTTEMREVIDAILYMVRGGCSWRLLPHDFPPWGTVYSYFWTFRKDGLWQRIHDRLRDRLRRQEERPRSPSAAILDSQSVKTTEKGGREGTTRARRSRAASAI
jgi:putative transposase